jgi:hypothetical protein
LWERWESQRKLRLSSSLLFLFLFCYRVVPFKRGKTVNLM